MNVTWLVLATLLHTYLYDQTHQIVHIDYMQFFMYLLYLNKTGGERFLILL